MSLASIQKIKEISPHPNADSLEFAHVLGYKCIVRKGQFKADELVVFIEPDTVLPSAEWAKVYKDKSSRVKAIKLRGQWSMGIVESLSILSFLGTVWDEGDEVSELLGITKYEAPAPQDLAAAGPYGFGIPKTDEERWQGLETLPYGEKVDVTLKVDGQSWSAFYWSNFGMDHAKKTESGVGGRSFLYKLDGNNKYIQNEKQYNVLHKLWAFCETYQVNLCLRGEQYGQGIQAFAANPHAKLPLGLAFYSTWLIDERRYARKGDRYYIFNIADELGLPTVPVLERDVILTPELIAKYDEELTEIAYKIGEESYHFKPQPFEGVVINWSGGSFKVINKHYDSRK